MYFKKKKSKDNNSKSRKRWNNCNSRQKRKARRETISEAQRLAIVNAVLSKKRLLIYSESL